jgi:UDP-2,3-diacylglucosamine hydrolase
MGVLAVAEKKNIGLVAGRGCLPLEVLKEIKTRGQTATVIGLQGEVSPELAELADLYYEIFPGQLGGMIVALAESGAREVVMAGKVSKDTLFIGGFDEVFQRVLQNLTQKNDDAILLAIVKEFEDNGLKVAKQTDYLHHLLAPKGMIIGNITDLEMSDVNLGFRMAKAIGELDIGQSVIIKQGVVLAVEAIEGTDQAIIRGGTLGGPGSVVVKVSKPQQDERFDVPTVGQSTIESMAGIKAAVLAVEAGKTLITEKEGLLSLAAENNIKIIAI